MYRIGKESSGGSERALSSFFRISTGAACKYIDNVLTALLSLKPSYLRWHTDNKKAEMKARCAVGYGFRECVGIIDGTLIFLEKRPILNGEAYYNRKGGYAVNVIVVCDDNAKVLYMYGGWPGSTHDNRAFRNSRMYNGCRSEYFDPKDRESEEDTIMDQTRQLKAINHEFVQTNNDE